MSERTKRLGGRRPPTFAALLVLLGLGLSLIAIATVSPASPGPALTEIASAPPDPSRSRTATFAYTNVFAVERFECSLDGAPFEPCGAERPSSITYTRLVIGRHVFRVRAVSGSRIGAARTYGWTIALGDTRAGGRDQGTGTEGASPARPASRGLSIGGSASPGALLYPGGPAVTIPLTVRSESAVAIRVTSLRVAIDAERLPVGCRAAWFRIVQPSASAQQPLILAPGESATLPSQGVTAPTIRMLDLGNQDACKRATLHLLYSGSARS